MISMALFSSITGIGKWLWVYHRSFHLIPANHFVDIQFSVFLDWHGSSCEMECILYAFNKLVCQFIVASPFMTRSIQLVWTFINALIQKLPSHWARTWHSGITHREHLEWGESGKVSSFEEEILLRAIQLMEVLSWLFLSRTNPRDFHHSRGHGAH